MRALLMLLVVANALGAMAAFSPAHAWYDRWGRWHPNYDYRRYPPPRIGRTARRAITHRRSTRRRRSTIRASRIIHRRRCITGRIDTASVNEFRVKRLCFAAYWRALGLDLGSPVHHLEPGQQLDVGCI